MQTRRLLILPGDPEYEECLDRARRPDWAQVAASDNWVAHVALPGSAGLLTPLSWKEFEEYSEGGGYEECLQELGLSEDFEFL